MHPDLFDKLLVNDKNLQSITLLLASVGIGVTIGYLCHQAVFAYKWVKGLAKMDLSEITSKKIDVIWPVDNVKKYYHIEFLWQNTMINIENDSKRDYITGRYRHYLSTIHGLGALALAQLLSSVISTGIFLWNIVYNDYQCTYIILNIAIIFAQFVLFLLFWKNQKYFSNLLMDFQGKILAELLKEKE